MRSYIQRIFIIVVITVIFLTLIQLYIFSRDTSNKETIQSNDFVVSDTISPTQTTGKVPIIYTRPPTRTASTKKSKESTLKSTKTTNSNKLTPSPGTVSTNSNKAKNKSTEPKSSTKSIEATTTSVNPSTKPEFASLNDSSSLDVALFPDPTISLYTFHLNSLPTPHLGEKAIHPVKTSNRIFVQNKLKYETPTNKNVAFATLFGMTKYISNKELQLLLLGSIKTFRDPTKGNWKGSIIIITDKPRFVRKLLHKNKSFLKCTPENYDPIPSEHINPKYGDNDCRISVKYAKLPDDNNPLKYKFMKSRMLELLEDENKLRIHEKLPIFDYIFYRDVDIWSWSDTDHLIQYMAKQYKGHEVGIWVQPGKPFESRGEILHGGIWMIHRELSYYWLRAWTTFMTMLMLRNQQRDQVSLGMTVLTHKWDYKKKQEERNKIGYHIDMLLIPFGRLYPLNFRSEWKNGVFLHWTGRKVYPNDKKAFAECSATIQLSKAKTIVYKDEDEVPLQVAPNENATNNLVDKAGNPMDVLFTTTDVTCITKQVILHINKFIKPRKIFMIVPKLTDCSSSFYFAPNIFCFARDEIITHPDKSKVKEVRKYLDIFLPLTAAVDPSWNNIISPSFLYMDENMIPLTDLYHLNDPLQPILTRKASKRDLSIIKALTGKQFDKLDFGASAIPINRSYISSMLTKLNIQTGKKRAAKKAHQLDSLIKSIKKLETQYKFEADKTLFHIIYYGYISMNNIITKNNIRSHKKLILNPDNSEPVTILNNVPGRCLRRTYMKTVADENIEILIF